MSTQSIDLKPDDLLDVQRVGGDVTIEGSDRAQVEARGDSLHVEIRPGVVELTSSSDLVLRVPSGARLSLGSVGGDVELENLTGPVEINLVGGDVNLRNLSGAVRLAGMIGGETHFENVTDVAMTSGKMGDRFNVAERVRRKVEQATRRAESTIRRAERRASAQWRTAGGSADLGSWGFGERGSAVPVNEPGDPVSDEERMKVLRMLQEKKITSEQADQLLSALEGKD